MQLRTDIITISSRTIDKYLLGSGMVATVWEWLQNDGHALLFLLGSSIVPITIRVLTYFDNRRIKMEKHKVEIKAMKTRTQQELKQDQEIHEKKNEKKMKKKLVILLAGHGGASHNKIPTYATAPDKMAVHKDVGPLHDKGPKGHLFYEGVYNREVAYFWREAIESMGLNCIVVHDPYDDTELLRRAERINLLAEVYDCIVFELHANGGGGDGMEVFTSPGETGADDLASHWVSAFKVTTANQVQIRADYSDGDPDKEARFTVLMNTICPHILIELDFFDTKKGVKRLMDPDYINQCALAGAISAARYFYFKEG